jgi:hypothetical protein
MRCIFSDEDQVNTLFENMSRGFAELCDSFATVMAPDPNNVPEDGYWGTVEFPAIKQTGNRGGQVDTVKHYVPYYPDLETDVVSGCVL